MSVSPWKRSSNSCVHVGFTYSVNAGFAEFVGLRKAQQFDI